jgi:hypothetical protein
MPVQAKIFIRVVYVGYDHVFNLLSVKSVFAVTGRIASAGNITKHTPAGFVEILQTRQVFG